MSATLVSKSVVTHSPVRPNFVEVEPRSVERFNWMMMADLRKNGKGYEWVKHKRPNHIFCPSQYGKKPFQMDARLCEYSLERGGEYPHDLLHERHEDGKTIRPANQIEAKIWVERNALDLNCPVIATGTWWWFGMGQVMHYPLFTEHNGQVNVELVSERELFDELGGGKFLFVIY